CDGNSPDIAGNVSLRGVYFVHWL
ncbi:hypothetical protein A2U01_0063328, partial [Trifolium medium]|nr:hypothetical protein [Trifolium medium]